MHVPIGLIFDEVLGVTPHNPQELVKHTLSLIR